MVIAYYITILMFISALNSDHWNEASNDCKNETCFNGNSEGSVLKFHCFTASEVSVIDEWVECVEWGIVGSQEHEVKQDNILCYHIKYQKGDHL